MDCNRKYDQKLCTQIIDQKGNTTNTRLSPNKSICICIMPKLPFKEGTILCWQNHAALCLLSIIIIFSKYLLIRQRQNKVQSEYTTTVIFEESRMDAGRRKQLN